MSSTPIELHFDVVSPYSYLAVQRIDALRERTGRAVIWRPFFLGGVLQASGNRAPAMVPNKGIALLRDLTRSAAQLGVPFRYAESFPFSTIAHQRILTVLSEEDQAGCEALTRALFRAYWAEGVDPADVGALADLIRGVGLDPEPLLAATQDQRVKDALKAATDAAVDRGAFGAPTFFVGERMWWGHDRMDLLAFCLENEVD